MPVPFISDENWPPAEPPGNATYTSRRSRFPKPLATSGPRSRGSDEPAGLYGRSGRLAVFSRRMPSGVVCWAMLSSGIAHVSSAHIPAAAKSLFKNIIEPSRMPLLYKDDSDVSIDRQRE